MAEGGGLLARTSGSTQCTWNIISWPHTLETELQCSVLGFGNQVRHDNSFPRGFFHPLKQRTFAPRSLTSSWASHSKHRPPLPTILAKEEAFGKQLHAFGSHNQPLISKPAR